MFRLTQRFCSSESRVCSSRKPGHKPEPSGGKEVQSRMSTDGLPAKHAKGHESGIPFSCGSRVWRAVSPSLIRATTMQVRGFSTRTPGCARSPAGPITDRGSPCRRCWNIPTPLVPPIRCGRGRPRSGVVAASPRRVNRWSIVVSSASSRLKSLSENCQW